MTTPNEPQPLMKPADIARRLNVTTRTAYDMLAPGGALHHLRVELGERTVRVDPSAFEAFLQRQGTLNAGAGS